MADRVFSLLKSADFQGFEGLNPKVIIYSDDIDQSFFNL